MITLTERQVWCLIGGVIFLLCLAALLGMIGGGV